MLILLQDQKVKQTNKQGFVNYEPTWFGRLFAKRQFNLAGWSHVVVWFGCRDSDSRQAVSMVTRGRCEGVQSLETEFCFTDLNEEAQAWCLPSSTPTNANIISKIKVHELKTTSEENLQAFSEFSMKIELFPQDVKRIQFWHKKV